MVYLTAFGSPADPKPLSVYSYVTAMLAYLAWLVGSKSQSQPNSGTAGPRNCLPLGPKLASLGALFGPKPPELGGDWLLEPTSQARYANIAGTSYLIASQSLFSLSGLMVLFSCLSAKGLGGDREALTINPT